MLAADRCRPGFTVALVLGTEDKLLSQKLFKEV
jgi:hypothetical protein